MQIQSIGIPAVLTRLPPESRAQLASISVSVLLAPRRLLLLTDVSLLVLREVTPLEQLLHVMLFPLSPAAPPH